MREPRPLPVGELNRLQRAGYARADALEPRFVRILEPILNRSADSAARRFEQYATDYLTASGAPAAREADRAALAGASRADARGLLSSLALTAAAPEPTSCMIALYPRPDEATALAEPGAEEAAVMHVTLCYLGEVDPAVARRVAEALNLVAGTHPPLAGTVGGIASFDDQGSGYPSILLPDVPGLIELRTAVCEAVLSTQADYARNHGYQAHLTVAYRPDGPETPQAASLGAPLHFDKVCVVQGDVILAELPLTGAPALTAAAAWGSPAGDEVVDVDALVAELRGKTDPVRLAVIRDSMTPVLEGAGLNFDVTNPLTANVLAQSGSQITNIAETTQLNAMRIIRRSYEEGLSIPDTASAIRGGMREATTARATLIARTELAGATNGGSLAAVEIVSSATGQAYWKEWLTSPGAPHPRHDHYPDLNHQTRKLDDSFTVGGHALRYPGDFYGPPSEVCNCRCALAYVDKPPTGREAEVGEAGLGAASAPSLDVVTAIREYTAAGGEQAGSHTATASQRSSLNEWLRGGTVEEPVYRGFAFSGDVRESSWLRPGETIDVGDVFTGRSFTKDRDRIATYGSGEHKVLVEVEGGIQGREISPWSIYPEELEVLAAPGVRLEVVSATQRYGDSPLGGRVGTGLWDVKVRQVDRPSQEGPAPRSVTKLNTPRSAGLDVSIDVPVPTARTARNEMVDALTEETSEWPPESRSLAVAAVEDARTRNLAVGRSADGELRAVASWAHEDGALIVHNLAAAGGRGEGTELLRRLASRAADEGVAIEANATSAARSYYERLGWKLRDGSANRYWLPPEEARAFGAGLEGIYRG